MAKIKSIHAHKILDSRGNWTIEAIVTLEDGSIGRSGVPSGASVGENEAKTVDVDQALSTINGPLALLLSGKEAQDQSELDELLLTLDATPDKSRLGANSLLPVSLGLAVAQAISLKLPLFRYLRSLYLQTQPQTGKTNPDFALPCPLFNLLNGGAHAQNNLDFQEFLLIPGSFLTLGERVEMGEKCFHRLAEILRERGFEVGVGDEGGYAPVGVNNEDALKMLSLSVTSLGYRLGQEAFLGLDCAASRFLVGNLYRLSNEARVFTPFDLKFYYSKLKERFNLIYLEDPFHQNAFDDFADFAFRMGKTTEVIGDDLTTTNTQRLTLALEKKALGGVVVKPNQIGTLSETLRFAKMARSAGLTLVVSHRSGETTDTFIADLSVALGARYIKTGAPSRGERVAKYNRLLEIAEELAENG